MKNLSKIFSNKQGSALVWVLVICLIFGILGVAIGWVALSMNRRSIKNDNLNQSYFTARSMAETVFNGLNGYDSSDSKSKAFYEDLYKNLVYGNRMDNENYFVQYTDVLNTEPEAASARQEEASGMGACNVEAAMSMGMAKITATATVNDTSDTVILEAYRKPESIVWPAKEWATKINVDDYKTGTKYRQIYIGNNTSIKNDESQKNIIAGAMDVAVYSLDQPLEGKLTVSRDTTRTVGNDNENLEKKAIFIYLEKGAKLTLTGMDFALFNQTVKVGTNDNTKDKWFETEKGYTTEDWGNYYGPDVFIYMEDGSEIIFNNPNRNTGSDEVVPFAIYIAGVGNTQTAPIVSAGSDVGNSPVKIYWMQDVQIKEKNGSREWLRDSEGVPFSKNENNGVANRQPLSGYKQAGKPYSDNDTKAGEELKDNGGILQNRWEIYQYERKQVQ